MNYNLVIKHEAFIDTVEAYVYYENQQLYLGEEFLGQLDLFYQRIIVNPFHFPSKVKPYHEAFIKKFPHIIVFQINEKDLEIIVFAIFNTHQDPNKKLK